MSTPETKYLTRTDAAKYVAERGIPLAKNTLQKMATTGGGPIYRIFGCRALYAPSDLDCWISEKMSGPRRSTSEAA